jgi:hypothetical protein
MNGQIPNTKFQIPNKFQYINSNELHLEFGIWYLEFGATRGSDR